LTDAMVGGVAFSRARLSRIPQKLVILFRRADFGARRKTATTCDNARPQPIYPSDIEGM
jgi:hypothetical protein